MNCLPLYFGKIESLDADGNKYYSTYNIYTSRKQSFNDQPAINYPNYKLIWKDRLGEHHRDYNKPAVIYLQMARVAYYEHGWLRKTKQ